MADLALIVGVGVVSLIIIMIMNTLDDEKHWHLKLVLIFFILSILLLVPKSVMDSETVCEPVIQTIDTVGAIQTYNYTDYCFERPEDTGYSFLRRTQVMYYLVVGYIVVAIGIWGMMNLIDSWKQRGQR